MSLHVSIEERPEHLQREFRLTARHHVASVAHDEEAQVAYRGDVAGGVVAHRENLAIGVIELIDVGPGHQEAFHVELM